MPSAIVETPVQGTPIDAPIDADLRNAASVRVPFQATGNRLNWLEAFVKRIGGVAADLITTALLVPMGNLTLRLTSGALIIDGNDDNNIHIGGINGSPGGVQFYANGLMAGRLFTAGRTGNANKKPATPVSGGGPYTIDPSLNDVFDFTPNSAIVVNIETSPAHAYEDGYCFRVINRATALGYTIAIKRDSGAVTVFTLAPGVAGGPAFCDVMFRAGAWSEIGSNRLA